jgi:hypothetical protein
MEALGVELRPPFWNSRREQILAPGGGHRVLSPQGHSKPLPLRPAQPLNRDGHHARSNASRNLIQINVAPASNGFAVIATVLWSGCRFLHSFSLKAARLGVIATVLWSGCRFLHSFSLKAARLGGLFLACCLAVFWQSLSLSHPTAHGAW